MPHRFQPQQIVTSKSGATYKILDLRSDDHHLLGGEIGYLVCGWKNDKKFGPFRLIRDSALRA